MFDADNVHFQRWPGAHAARRRWEDVEASSYLAATSVAPREL